MSLLDKASLIVTPNAYKESKLYSVIPTSGAGDMNVGRATTATRKNSAGLIEVVPRNLLTYSEQFDDSSWVKYSSGTGINPVVTANNTIAPNGENTADKIVFNSGAGTTASNYSLISKSSIVTLNATQYTLSFYAKGNVGGEKLMFRGVSSGSFTKLTLTTSWQRYTITETSIGISSSVDFGIRRGLSEPMDSSATVFIWGMQLDESSTATEYFPTTNRLNIPRIDYTNGSCPSLLVEPQRTNLILYSEQFDNADWMKISATITANTTTAPSGINTADTLVITSGGYLLKQILSFSAVTGQKVTASIFVKNQTTNFLEFGGATPAGTDVYSIENYGNGWYRHKVTRTFTVTAVATLQFIIYNKVGTHFIWGAQVEAGAYATSYIPTVGSAVTRNADVISKTGISSLIGQTEGTLFCQIKAIADDNVEKHITLSDGTNNNIVDLYYGFWGAGSIYCGVKVAGTTQGGLLVGALTVTNMNKIAVVYKTNRFELWINGTKIAQDLVGTTFSGTTLSKLETAQNGINTFFGNINSIQLYKTALSNTELAQLTTI